ncbi:hypothetical protein JHK86_000751 [Glycine max]|nr:hypothetical protein JHK86_000751 [Glycine max]
MARDDNGKATEGVDMFLGGRIGSDSHLSQVYKKGVLCKDFILWNCCYCTILSSLDIQLLAIIHPALPWNLARRTREDLAIHRDNRHAVNGIFRNND